MLLDFSGRGGRLLMRLSGPCFKQKYVDNAQKENRKGCTKSKGHKFGPDSSPLMSISGGGGVGGRETVFPFRANPLQPYSQQLVSEGPELGHSGHPVNHPFG